VGALFGHTIKPVQIRLILDRLGEFGLEHAPAAVQARGARLRVDGQLINASAIALVDDDRNILTSVSIALESEGYRIMTYTDGASALDGFKTGLLLGPIGVAVLTFRKERIPDIEVACPNCGTRQEVDGALQWFECWKCEEKSDVPR